MVLKLDPRRVDTAGDSHQAARDEKEPPMPEKHLERVTVDQGNLAYEDAEHEPELRLRTWVALVAMWLYNLVIVLALNSPSAVVCRYLNFICHIGSLIILAGLIYREKPRCAKC